MRRLLITSRNGSHHGGKRVLNRRIAAPVMQCSFLDAATCTESLSSCHAHQQQPLPVRFRLYTTMTTALSKPPKPSVPPHQYHSNQVVRTKVFVSRHNTMTVTEKQILEQCANHGITLGDVRRTRSHVIIKECPFCDKPTNRRIISTNCTLPSEVAPTFVIVVAARALGMTLK